MSSVVLFSFVFGYFLLLLAVAYFTSKNSDNDSFFIGNRKSNWILVAFGMIGTSLSGVTFVSVPGTVGARAFEYYQVVIGYFLGYFVIAYILLPLYYKLNLTSIYKYLEDRFGPTSYKTGALFFIFSRTLGATARMYLVINILQIFILDDIGIPFVATAFVMLLLILLYTFEGGVKTIVYTDTLQTSFMLLGLIVCIWSIMSSLGLNIETVSNTLRSEGLTHIFNTNVATTGFWAKQILGGAFITVAMTGLDQEMMQKNISVKTLKDSQKNVLTLASILLIVNMLFLILGALLVIYSQQKGLNIKGDDLFPTIALKNYLPPSVAIIFIIGLISALFPSADGALTAMTSSFCIDILGIAKDNTKSDDQKRKTRLMVHFSFALLFFLCVLIFKWIDNKSIIEVILKVAGYTYGPLLGMFAFGILTKRNIKDSLSILVCLISPFLAYFLTLFTKNYLSFEVGIEILIINGLITFCGLWMISSSPHQN
jgi:SSS family transporter